MVCNYSTRVRATILIMSVRTGLVYLEWRISSLLPLARPRHFDELFSRKTLHFLLKRVINSVLDQKLWGATRYSVHLERRPGVGHFFVSVLTRALVWIVDGIPLAPLSSRTALVLPLSLTWRLSPLAPTAGKSKSRLLADSHSHFPTAV